MSGSTLKSVKVLGQAVAVAVATVILAACTSAPQLGPGQVAVGDAVIALPGPDWQSATLPPKIWEFTSRAGSVDGQTILEQRLALWHQTGTEVDGLMVVSQRPSFPGRTRANFTCVEEGEKTPSYVRNDAGAGVDRAACAWVWTRANPSSFLGRLTPEIRAKVLPSGVALAPGMHFVGVNVQSGLGAMVALGGMVAPALESKGLALPKNPVAQAELSSLASWADAVLDEAVKASTALSPSLHLPPLTPRTP